ncbi:glycoside hydrolase family 13 protein [Streptomyces sp. DSM 44938]|uniref:Glycoside hydrolase family 13 protein n=1 Tax=Streptomyces litchfieldiae TaxID=3075543 RepID=A0ABU2MS24_9ACTN|nr:glycoside hydrolase family 13 protein [Streptomyces sp. DSM 44938]MDT0344434.1 glycoside hydrolase family 13 protein [Streptomyces sp. DSM 44938]
MTDSTWWRDSVVYQVYVPSFADSDGDGVGDLNGIAERLDHLAGLGVDAVWLTPFYRSPWADGGYDVADYRDVDPRHGTLDDFRALLARAHGLGLKVIVDIVPNHCSDRHPWFAEALAAGPGSAARDRFVFRDGKGPDGAEPPSDWQSKFGGPAWTRVPDGQWYMHIFAAEQPDLNWENPEVAADFERTLRFWLDLGVDGFRIDVAHGLRKDLAEPLRETHGNDAAPLNSPPEGDNHPFWDRDEVHEIYRSWRKLTDSYRPPRITVAEAGVSAPRLPLYTRPDELHQAFNFFYLRCPWGADDFRRVIDTSLAGARSVGTLPTWVLSNHDVVRHTTRYALPPGTDLVEWLAGDGRAPAPDPALGRRRARAAALLTLALPGTAYLYQGEELGLPEVGDLPREALRDPMWERTGHRQKGRDGCRVPLPWTRGGPSYGFGPAAASWLPQPPGWGDLSVEAQRGRADSFLELYRAALTLRRTFLDDDSFRWLPGADGELAFAKGRLECRINFTAEPLPLPHAGDVLLSSGPLPDATLPPDTAVWLGEPGK